MLCAVVKRGAPTIANDVLRWVRRMFDYAIKRHQGLVRFNPAAAFDLADAGGKELARERALSRDERVTLFEAMRQAKGFSVQNELTVKLLLLLAGRKVELIAARWDEFELKADPPVWHLPGMRTKTGQPLDIPLPSMAVEWLQKMQELACNAEYVLPACKLQSRMLPHVCESTLGVAMGKVKHGMPYFTVHDLRRTARTHLAAMGVAPHVAERCLNHKLKSVEGVYDRHDYFEERSGACRRRPGDSCYCSWSVVRMLQVSVLPSALACLETRVQRRRSAPPSERRQPALWMPTRAAECQSDHANVTNIGLQTRSRL